MSNKSRVTNSIVNIGGDRQIEVVRSTVPPILPVTRRHGASAPVPKSRKYDQRTTCNPANINIYSYERERNAKIAKYWSISSQLAVLLVPMARCVLHDWLHRVQTGFLTLQIDSVTLVEELKLYIPETITTKMLLNCVVR